MGQTMYFDEELTRLRRLWMLAVKRHDSDGARDTSTAYFHRAEELRAGSLDASHKSGRRTQASLENVGRHARL
jgi:hypothetical protein